MTEIQRITESLRDATDLNAFWDIAHVELKRFGVSGVFYGRLAASKEVVTAEKNGDGFVIGTGLLTKTSYSNTFLSAFGNGDLVEKDPTVSHCLSRNDVLKWTFNKSWAERHSWYCKRYEIERDFGYHKGCSIPSSHFSDRWVGGMGVAMSDVPDDDFDDFWHNHQKEIIQICGLLDSGMRNLHSEEFVGLTARENECLTWLSVGLTPQQIAHKLNLSDGRVATIFSQAKRKLNATTRDHAVARALLLNIIEP